MSLKFDWKFIVSLALSVAGILIPVWLWQADLQGRSINFKVVSQTSLQPVAESVVSDLKLMVGGVPIEQPYLSVVELVNDGRRPISKSDYESDVKVSMGAGASLVRVQVAALLPQDLRPEIASDKSAFHLSPLLLNPGDKLTFSILTAGEKPSFAVRSRIIGVSEVSVIDQSSRQPKVANIVLRSSVGGLLLILYFSFALATLLRARYELSSRVVAVGALANGLGSALLLVPIVRDVATTTSAMYWAIIVVAPAIALFAAQLLNRRKIREF